MPRARERVIRGKERGVFTSESFPLIIMDTFLLWFIPLFVAMDSPGAMPIFLGLTHGLPQKQRKKVLIQSLLTAFIVGILFLFGGIPLFRFLGISLGDFQIAGGIVLLIIAILDLTHVAKELREPDPSVGIVPIGVPLIIGPAALTTLIMLGNEFGTAKTVLSLIINLVLTAIALSNAKVVERVVGVNGMKAFSKIISLFLAAIAVMFIRVGIQNVFGLAR